MNNPAILKFSSSEPKTTQTRKATASSVIWQNTANSSKKCFGGGAGEGVFSHTLSMLVDGGRWIAVCG